jgi:hypothetical protein
MTITYRHAKGSALTHAEMDENLRDLREFSQSATYPAGTVGKKLQSFVSVTDFGGDIAKFETARDALTSTVGFAGIRAHLATFDPLAVGSLNVMQRFVTGTAAGDFEVVMDNTTSDPTLSFGYNTSASGVNTNPSLFFTIEGDYDTGAFHVMEAHLQGHNKDGTGYRPWTWLVKRDANYVSHSLSFDRLEWLDLTSTKQFLIVDTTSTLASFDFINLNAFAVTVSANNGMTLKPTTAGTVFFKIADNTGAKEKLVLTVNGGSQEIAQIVVNTTAGISSFYIGSNGGLIPISFMQNGATVAALQTDGTFHSCSQTAIPAGGTAGAGFRVSSTSNFGVFFGSGAPSLSAAKGSLYLRSDGSGTTDRAYINTNGSTTWTALTTVA